MQYVQEKAVSELLQRTVLANEEILSKLHASLEHPGLKSFIRPKTTLAEIARLGVQDATLAWPMFQALWAELNATAPATNPAQADGPTKSIFQKRPPLLVTVDGLSHWMQESRYRDADFKPVHAHDLVFVKHFLSLLQPAAKDTKSQAKPQLANGGIVMYATSGSNSPTVPTFDLALDQLRARQEGVSESSDAFPQPDPYAKTDARVLDLFKQAATSSVEVQELGGLSREEARGFMEYFARSGILQEKVTDEWVSEKWSLAGGGIIGEMEKLGKRLRTVL